MGGAGGDRVTVARAARLRGTIAVPGDKSITHRALLCNAVAAGDAAVEGFLDAADTRSTLEAVRALGVERVGVHVKLDCRDGGGTLEDKVSSVSRHLASFKSSG